MKRTGHIFFFFFFLRDFIFKIVIVQLFGGYNIHMWSLQHIVFYIVLYQTFKSYHDNCFYLWASNDRNFIISFLRKSIYIHIYYI